MGAFSLIVVINLLNRELKMLITSRVRLKTSSLMKSSLVLDRYKHSFVLLHVNKPEVHNSIMKRECSVGAGVNCSVLKPPKIPYKIKRGPTELLEALAATVGEDPTGHGYEYIDDPFLLPYTERDRDEFKAAHSFGEAAADMVFRNMPQLFHMDTAIPKIESFYPHPFQIELKGGIERLNKMGWNDDMFYDGDRIDRIAESFSLNEKIEYFVLTQKVEEAVQFYEGLSTEQRASLTDPARSQLFQLLAYFGNVDREATPVPVKLTSTLQQAEQMNPSEDLVSSIDNMAEQAQPMGNMDQNCLARQIFKTIKNKSTDDYAAMIKALTKYQQNVEAYDTFQRCLEQQMPFEVEVYNSILRCWSPTSSFGQSYEKFVLKMLTMMRDNNIVPNSNTFLEVLRNIPDVKSCEVLLMPTMKEVEVLGIKPNLALYAVFFRLSLFTRTKKYREMANVDNVRSIKFEVITAALNKALRDFDSITDFDILKSGELPSADTFDFLPAAVLVATITKDTELAERLLQFGKRNPYLLKFTSDRAEFFKKYIETLSHVESSKEWSKRLFASVPTLFTPTANMFIKDVIPQVTNKNAHFCVPKLWDMLKLAGYAQRSQVVLNDFCTLLAETKSSQLANEEKIRIADDLIEVIDVVNYTVRRDKKPAVGLNTKILGDLLSVFIDCKDVNKAAQMFVTGMQLLSSVRMAAFESILSLFWDNNMIVRGEEFCRECLDSLPPDSPKGQDILAIFADQFSSELPREVLDRFENGQISKQDFESIGQNAQLAIERMEKYVDAKISSRT